MRITRHSTAGADVVAVVGAAGQLGCELLRPQRTCGPTPRVVHGLDIDQVDITRYESVTAMFERLRPGLVINAAAYTDVDGCESQVEQAFAVNATGPQHLARACREYGARLVHVSTDYVFDGRKHSPYLPEDPVNPQSVYGKSKAEGEQRVRQTLADHVIVRTSWLFGAGGRNFVKTILQAATERPELHVVTDQVGCPTYAKDLAAALLALGLSDRTGTYHFCNAGVCSWNAFASRILELAGLSTPVRPMTTAQLKRPAPRPAYSVLDTSRLTEHTGIQPRSWQEALAECMAELKQAACKP